MANQELFWIRIRERAESRAWYTLPQTQYKLHPFKKSLYGDFSLDLMLLKPQEEITCSIYGPSVPLTVRGSSKDKW